MKRCVAILLLIAVACVGAGAGEWLHESLGHSHDDVACDAAHAGPQLRKATSDAADRDHCLVCIGLHAPAVTNAGVDLDVQMSLAVDRVIALQAQRLDASMPAPRGCRGPPAM